ncbi:MAG: S1C family serine protease [Rhodospirillales bacterium]|jgi:S1-C subfamily serine protease
MSDEPQSIDVALQPKPSDVVYDLDRALASVVGLRAQTPPNAFTAQRLGTDRSGHGVLIRDNGLVLTIGYLINEAESIWLVDCNGQATPAHVIGSDTETGFGLVQAMGDMSIPAIPLGSSAELKVDDPVIMAGFGGRQGSVMGSVLAKREFAGYWEYVLDEAIFTAPPHPFWGGSGLIGPDGTLRGIGSLFVQQALGDDDSVDGNMVVPIDLLKPILDDLMSYGRRNKPPRPWVGMLTAESEGHLIVGGLFDGGPADQTGVQVGDLVAEVASQPVHDLAQLFRSIWRLGDAGVGIPLTLIRDGQEMHVEIPSACRSDFYLKPKVH